MEFLNYLKDGDSLIIYPLIAGILGSFAFGIIGSFVVVRKISYIAGAISHTVLGGIGFAAFVNYYWQINWFSEKVGAMLAALLAAVFIALTKKFGKSHEESLIGVVWVLGMAIGAILMKFTPVYNNANNYLFGSILFITPNDLWQLLGLNCVIILAILLFYNKILAICFDEQFAEVRGISYPIYFLILLIITSIAVVMMIQIIGLILVVALLTLPAATALIFTKKLWHTMILAFFICAVSVVSGFAVSFSYDLPPGAMIVVFCSIIYLLAIIKKKILNL